MSRSSQPAFNSDIGMILMRSRTLKRLAPFLVSPVATFVSKFELQASVVW